MPETASSCLSPFRSALLFLQRQHHDPFNVLPYESHHDLAQRNAASLAFAGRLMTHWLSRLRLSAEAKTWITPCYLRIVIMRIWTCCSDAGCTTHRDSLEFLRRWAIEPEIGVDDDGLHFFEFDLPDGILRILLQRVSERVDRPDQHRHLDVQVSRANAFCTGPDPSGMSGPAPFGVRGRRQG